MRFGIRCLWIACVLACAVSPYCMAQGPSGRANAFVNRHCASCHDADNCEGGLDLSNLDWQAASGPAFDSRVRMFERIAAGEMHPESEEKPSAAAQTAFQTEVGDMLDEQDRRRIAADGRTMKRRLNRDEYENSLRDLLHLPWIQLRDILPEDGERYRYNKIGEALDVSHVQLSRYMSAAEQALQQALIMKPRPVSTAPLFEVRIDRIIKDVFQDSSRIGTAGDFPARYSEQELNLAAQHFNAVNPENCMKPERVHPEESTWRFEQANALVEWARGNKMSIRGHPLVWHAQTRDGFFRDGDREVVTQRMQEHTSTLVGRYKGKTVSWDVVNEAINDGGNADTGQTENLRDSKWIQLLGQEFLTLAFKFAHEADPDAALYDNDYNIESGPKHASSMVLLKGLLADVAPVHAFGIQCHSTK